MNLKVLMAIAAIIFSIISTSAQSQIGLCGDPPPVQDETLKGDIAGKAQFLSRFLGDAALTGKIETARSEIFSKYPNGERSDAYFQYQVCILLMQDTSMSTVEKLEELKKIHREFDKPIMSSPDRKSESDEVTLTVTKEEIQGCDSNNTLDITINNNSDNTILFTRFELVPERVGVHLSAGGGPPISATYDVSLDPWVDLALEAKRKDSDEPPKYKPINVPKILQDRFNIERNKLETFALTVGIERGMKVTASFFVRISTDQNLTISSKPIALTLCTA